MEVHEEEDELIDDILYDGDYEFLREVIGFTPDSATTSVLSRQHIEPPKTLWANTWYYSDPTHMIRAYQKAVDARKSTEEQEASSTIAWQPDTLGPIYWMMRKGIEDLWHAIILPMLSEFDWVALAKTCRSFAGIVR